MLGEGRSDDQYMEGTGAAHRGRDTAVQLQNRNYRDCGSDDAHGEERLQNLEREDIQRQLWQGATEEAGQRRGMVEQPSPGGRGPHPLPTGT